MLPNQSAFFSFLSLWFFILHVELSPLLRSVVQACQKHAFQGKLRGNKSTIGTDAIVLFFRKQGNCPYPLGDSLCGVLWRQCTGITVEQSNFVQLNVFCFVQKHLFSHQLFICDIQIMSWCTTTSIINALHSLLHYYRLPSWMTS